MYGVRQGVAVTYVNNIVIACLKRARKAHPTIARTAGDLHQDNCTRHRNCGNLCSLMRPTSIPVIHFPSGGGGVERFFSHQNSACDKAAI